MHGCVLDTRFFLCISLRALLQLYGLIFGYASLQPFRTETISRSVWDALRYRLNCPDLLGRIARDNLGFYFDPRTPQPRTPRMLLCNPVGPQLLRSQTTPT
ncbi:hypothetical protein EVAR_5155_1 [Eumeta japonica]|uniref:Uncharacterized protein n=1 Tax=Eumeta variegata TaxID=151549 RepID=A0A4C1SXH0_EUMVA|nr:hypothetical protein EVAR_5155_1 [Eumeta japonica]